MGRRRTFRKVRATAPGDLWSQSPRRAARTDSVPRRRSIAYPHAAPILGRTRAMSDPLGFCLVGCGMIARFHVKALADVPGTRVAALVDTVPGAAERLIEGT